MRVIGLALLMTMIFGPTFGQVACISGNAGNLGLVRDFNAEKNKDRQGFIVEIENSLSAGNIPNLVTGSCQPTHPLGADKASTDNRKIASELATMSKQIFDRTQDQIKLSCVAAALSSSTPQDKLLCSSKNEKGSSRKILAQETPCYTEPMVKHIHRTVSLAAACFDQIYLANKNTNKAQNQPQTTEYFFQPINKEVLFKKILQESKFHPTLADPRGNGIGQLTSAAFDAMSKEYKPIIDTIIDFGKTNSSSACAPFVKPLETPTEWQGGNRCKDVVGFGENFARNIIYSIGYFAARRTEAIPKIKGLSANPSDPDYQKLVDLYAMYKYRGTQPILLNKLVKNSPNLKTVFENLENLARTNKNRDDYIVQMYRTSRQFTESYLSNRAGEEDLPLSKIDYSYCFSGADE